MSLTLCLTLYMLNSINIDMCFTLYRLICVFNSIKTYPCLTLKTDMSNFVFNSIKADICLTPLILICAYNSIKQSDRCLTLCLTL